MVGEEHLEVGVLSVVEADVDVVIVGASVGSILYFEEFHKGEVLADLDVLDSPIPRHNRVDGLFAQVREPADIELSHQNRLVCQRWSDRLIVKYLDLLPG